MSTDELSSMTIEALMALYPHPSPPAPIPLIYDDAVSTTFIQKVLFVNSYFIYYYAIFKIYSFEHLY